MVLLSGYPSVSQSYKETELRYLQATHELEVVSFGSGNIKYPKHYPFQRVQTYEDVLKVARSFVPDVIHAHYLHYTPIVFKLSKILKKPFTLRSHSFDILEASDEQLHSVASMVNDDLCRGVLVFPFLKERLVRCGFKAEKLLSAMPVVDFDRFYNTSPNGRHVLNTGAAIPKKDMASFLQIAKRVPEKPFVIFPIGYFTPQLKTLNKELGSPVKFARTVDLDVMPTIYKRSEWLIYTADSERASVGWPMAIDEARASGVGVLMKRVRDDITEYIDGAGYVYTTEDEAADIVRGPVPNDVREKGFELARRSDISINIAQLTGLWQ
jgi:glycosyltransferase involved in cell wall biosynthesis